LIDDKYKCSLSRKSAH